MRGIFMLWIEVELAWGRGHRKKIDLPRMRTMAINVRKLLDSVTSLLERYSIPVTWTILGHLLLDHCNKSSVNELPHPSMPRPTYSWLRGDWYKYDPCTDIKKDPAWYGKDIVDRIVKYVRVSKLTHDIGCHSFSHQQFGDPGCGEELARAEIKKCMDLMEREYGIIVNSFAYPRDYVGHMDVLKEFNFIGFRDTPPKLYPCLKLEKTISNFINTHLSLFVQFMSYYFPFPPHVVTPREALPGLWAVPGCLAYSKKPFIPLTLVTSKAIKGIDRAIEEGKIFSMYTHLRNFGQYERLLSGFEKILSYVNRKREKGVLEVKTLTELVRDLSCGSK